MSNNLKSTPYEPAPARVIETEPGLIETVATFVATERTQLLALVSATVHSAQQTNRHFIIGMTCAAIGLR